jgi:alkylation response protein AidB-like acyl-CoA dehydrogenase
MSVGLLASITEEQALLLQASTRFLESEHPLSLVRGFADGADYDFGAYATTAAQLGWFGFLADPSQGGGSVSGNGLTDAALIAAERGARLQPGPMVGHSVVVHALADNASTTLEPLLSDLIQGSAWATWAFAPSITCSLRRDGDAYRINGTIEVAADVDVCSWLLVSAGGPDGLAQVMLRTDLPGITLHRLDGLDVTRRWYSISFDNTPVEYLVGTPGTPTEDYAERQLQVAAVLAAAEAVGSMHADLEMAVQYAKDRTAFGRPIGSFQAVKHLLADCSLWLEMSKGIVAAAATAVGAGSPDGSQLAHAAKSFVAERSMQVAHGCFQVFGGIGFTWDHDQHLYFRRIATDANLFGSASLHRRRLLTTAGMD